MANLSGCVCLGKRRLFPRAGYYCRCRLQRAFARRPRMPGWVAIRIDHPDRRTAHGGNAPELDEPVIAGCGQSPSSGGETDRVDAASVSLKLCHNRPELTSQSRPKISSDEKGERDEKLSRKDRANRHGFPVSRP